MTIRQMKGENKSTYTLEGLYLPYCRVVKAVKKMLETRLEEYNIKMINYLVVY